MQSDIYDPLWEGKARLRLYLNDPAIQEGVDMPIVLEGKVLFAEKDGNHYLIFKHSNPDFMPVFFDLAEKLTLDKLTLMSIKSLRDIVEEEPDLYSEKDIKEPYQKPIKEKLVSIALTWDDGSSFKYTPPKWDYLNHAIITEFLKNAGINLNATFAGLRSSKQNEGKIVQYVCKNCGKEYPFNVVNVFDSPPRCPYCFSTWIVYVGPGFEPTEQPSTFPWLMTECIHMPGFKNISLEYTGSTYVPGRLTFEEEK